MSIEVGKNNTEMSERAGQELVVDAPLPEAQADVLRRQALVRPLARPALGTAGDFDNELAARIG